MKHLKKIKTFSGKGNTKAMVKNLISNLILHGKITTTAIRAKYIKATTEKLITIAKKQNVSSIRTLLSKLPKKSAYKLYYEIAPKYKGRKGGYTRIIKLPFVRKKDGAKMAVIEFVE
jgi:large subunit ribosomal protein L17